MKKSIILVLIAITMVFASFVGGFYVGKNYNIGGVQISGLLPESTASATTTATQTPTGPSAGSAVQATAPVTGLININRANLEQLDSLPGIGPVLAQAIIDYRTEFGDFQTPEDLLNVSGIGEKKLEAILDYITTGG